MPVEMSELIRIRYLFIVKKNKPLYYLNVAIFKCCTCHLKTSSFLKAKGRLERTIQDIYFEPINIIDFPTFGSKNSR